MTRPFPILAAILLVSASALGQTGRTEAPKVDLAFNRFYDYGQVTEALERLVAAWPSLLRLQSIGKSVQGRDMWLVTINNPKTGPDTTKAAMYIDANVHGNEVQGAEVCLYTIWYLMENYGKVKRITDLVDEHAFYILPMVNPDGRDWWFHEANSSSSSRSGQAPFDSDRDGLLDEDPPNDLDGDGSITQMRMRVDQGGTHKIDPDDPRLLVRVKPDEVGTYIMLGSEGIDDDGDGRVNEDGPGGYDMNRNNPSDWQPGYVQSGAGDHPFSWPETRSIGSFILAHPNIASVQSYHNSGGMILRGPGAATVPEYPSADLHVYDELGKKGERMLPFYRYMIIHRDLYTVHGGFVNWTAEGLGIISYTNELWADPQAFGTKERTGDERREFDDLLMLGAWYKDWTPYEHPEYGTVEIGGWSKWSSRVPPPFMLEELCHRNMAFTLLQAEEMPHLAFENVRAEELGDGLWKVRATVHNDRLIPTRTALAAQNRIGLPDILELTGGRVVAASEVQGVGPRERLRPREDDLARLRIERGVAGEGRLTVEWIVADPPPYTLSYRSEKAGALTQTVERP